MTAPAELTAGSWHDLAPQVAETARGRLRMAEGDPDAGRLEPLARSAMAAIDHRLQLRTETGRMFYPLSDTWAVVTYVPDRVPADVLEAAVQLTVETYRRSKEVRYGVAPGLGLDGEAVRVSRDAVVVVEPLLAPHVEGWGLA